MLRRFGRGLELPTLPSLRSTPSFPFVSHPPIVPAPSLASPARRFFSADSAPAHHRDVAVLGGGISGLASAYYLSQALPNARITVFEASDRIGGWLSSKRVPVEGGSVLFEAGPRTLRPNANGVLTARLLQELDLARDAIFTQLSSPAARNRYVYFPDHLVRMPHPAYGLLGNMSSILTEPIFNGLLWNVLREPWKTPRDAGVEDESVGAFFSRRFGKTMTDQILSAVIHGIYAGDIWQLSARSLFPGPWRDEAQEGSVFRGMLRSRAEGVEMSKREADFLQEMKRFNWDPLLKATLKDTSVFTLKDGLSMLSDRLASKLFGSGKVTFRTSTPVDSIAPAEGNDAVLLRSSGSKEPETFTHVVSSLTPAHLNQVTGNANGGASLIPNIPSVTVMTVNLYFRSPALHEPGFGYLIPLATPFEKNPERALGVVFDSAYSPSPSDLDPSNWHDLSIEQLKAAREAGRLINVNDFAWYNLPDRPNAQDEGVSGTKLTVMLGGHWWDGWPSFPDEQEGLSLARSVLERHLGIKEEPEAWQVNLEKDCIPQYKVGHERKLKQAHSNLWREYKGRLRVVGNWTSGVGVNDCLRSAFEVAKRFERAGTGLEHVGESLTVRLKPVGQSAKASEEE